MVCKLVAAGEVKVLVASSGSARLPVPYVDARQRRARAATEFNQAFNLERSSGAVQIASSLSCTKGDEFNSRLAHASTLDTCLDCTGLCRPLEAQLPSALNTTNQQI